MIMEMDLRHENASSVFCEWLFFVKYSSTDRRSRRGVEILCFVFGKNLSSQTRRISTPINKAMSALIFTSLPTGCGGTARPLQTALESFGTVSTRVKPS